MAIDLIQHGAQWLADQRARFVSREVEYGAARDRVQATIGRTDFELDDGRGVVERFESRDFVVATADIAEPRRGDRIRETLGSTVFVYEVASPERVPAWRWADASRTAYRIHTKLVSTEHVP